MLPQAFSASLVFVAATLHFFVTSAHRTARIHHVVVTTRGKHRFRSLGCFVGRSLVCFNFIPPRRYLHLLHSLSVLSREQVLCNFLCRLIPLTIVILSYSCDIVLKTKMQASEDAEEMSMYEFARYLMENYGLKVFWIGVETSALQSATEKALYFFAYTALKTLYSATHSGPIRTLPNLVLGCMAEWAHLPVTLPLDCWTTKIQTNPTDDNAMTLLCNMLSEKVSQCCHDYLCSLWVQRFVDVRTRICMLTLFAISTFAISLGNQWHVQGHSSLRCLVFEAIHSIYSL